MRSIRCARCPRRCAPNRRCRGRRSPLHLVDRIGQVDVQVEVAFVGHVRFDDAVGGLDLVDDLGQALARLVHRLERRDGEQSAHDPPLVVVDRIEEPPDLVFEDLAADPDEHELEHDARRDAHQEQADSHLAVPGHHAHQIAGGHQHEHQPTRTVDGALEPAVHAGQFAHLALGPLDGLLAVPAAEEEQRHTGEQ